MTTSPIYDRLGRGYADRRRPDARIMASLLDALGDARTVLDVGAGTGNYEPVDRPVVALEPSATMIAQRPPAAAPAVRGAAEHLPFADDAFGAALAILTVHHWSEPDVGLRELRRVSRRQVVLTWDPTVQSEYWLVRDYVPEWRAHEASKPTLSHIVAALPSARVESVLVPRDCTDGFGCAYWQRPEAYLDPEVRASISTLALLDQELVDAAMRRLAADLDSGAWRERNADLLDLDEYDGGYRLVIAN
jgi:SAM-dependent methyltransferase